MESTIALLIPIGMVVVLPIVYVWFYFKSVNNKTNRRTEVIMRAIESNVDLEKMEDIFGELKKTAEEVLQIRLLRGSIFTLLGLSLVIVAFLFSNYNLQRLMCFLSAVCLSIGIGYLIVYFVTKKTVAKETESHEAE